MEIIEYLGNCSSIEIGTLAEKRGKKFSYKKACNLIKDYDKGFYDSLSLDLRNPWDHETNIKKGNVLHIVHSAVDHLFIIKKS